MSTIPAGTKFHGVATGVDTANKGSANANANRDAYTIEALASAINILIENNEIVNIVDFDWIGGSGTFVYTLPSATAIPYRKIRFVNNSTVSASNQIEIDYRWFIKLYY